MRCQLPLALDFTEHKVKVVVLLNEKFKNILIFQFIIALCVSLYVCGQAFLGLFQKEHGVAI
jgi:hypothetical protein